MYIQWYYFKQNHFLRFFILVYHIKIVYIDLYKKIKKMEDDKKKKSFSENAKGFLGTWKDNFAEKNKDILDRAKKRKEEHKELNLKIKGLWKDVKIEFGGTAKEIHDTLNTEIESFTKALKEGNATVAQKLQVEKRMQQMTTFMETTQDKGKEEFDKFAKNVTEKLLEFDVVPDIENMADDLKNIADENITEDNLGKLDDLQKNADDLDGLFGKKE